MCSAVNLASIISRLYVEAQYITSLAPVRDYTFTYCTHLMLTFTLDSENMLYNTLTNIMNKEPQ